MRGGARRSVFIGFRANVVIPTTVSGDPTPLDCVVIGANATVGSASTPPSGSVAIGGGATASVAAQATGSGAIAVGSGVLASGANTTCVGTAASATQASGVAIGVSASATGTNGAVAIGSSAAASSSTAVAVGPSSAASGGNSLAMGLSSTASATNAVALGPATQATATGSVAIGRDTANTGASTAVVDEIKVGTANHTLNVIGNAKLAGSGKTIALFGGTARTQPTRAGQLIDNSGGVSGGATVAAIGGAVDPTAALKTDTANAIATLAAKVNAIEDKLSGAGTGIGVTA